MAIDPATDLTWRRLPEQAAVTAVAGEFRVTIQRLDVGRSRWWIGERDGDVDPTFAAEGETASFSESMDQAAAALDDLGVVVQPEPIASKLIVEADLAGALHDGRLLAWRLASVREPVVVRAPIGAGHEARVEQAPFADDEFQWTIRPVGAAAGEPMAQGWSPSLDEAIGATEAAMVEGSQARAMTLEESAAHLAARPEFAARVDRTVRKLAEERGLLPAEGGQPAGGVVSSAKLGPVGRAFPDAGAASPARPAGPSLATAPGGDAPTRMRGR